MSVERRAFRRIPQSFVVQYRLFGAFTEGWRSGNAVNVSASGLRMRSEDVFEVGTTLTLHITLPGLRGPLDLLGRVAWSQAQAAGVSESGIEFMDLTSEQQAQIDELVGFLQRGA